MIDGLRVGLPLERRGARPWLGDLDLRENRRLLPAMLVGLDMLALAVAVSLAAVLRLQLDGVIPVVALGFVDRHFLASVLVLPIMVVLFRCQGLYDVDQLFAGTREYGQIAHAVTYGVLIGLAASYFAGGAPLVSRSWLLLVWVLSIGCVSFGRFAARRVVRRLRRRGALHSRVVVVGASTLGVAVAEQLRAAADEGLDVVGFLDEYLPLGQPLLADVGVIGRPGDLARGSVVADEYILVPQALPHERLAEITRLMVCREGPRLHMAVSSTDLLTHGMLLRSRAGVPVVTLSRARLSGIETVLKYGLDALGAAVALLALGPAALVLLLRGWISRKGPLLSRHAIYAAGGTRITLWLLGPGVTTSLLLRGAPALLWVLLGRLSLVGPRPTIWKEDEPLPAELWLTSVKPGLTGPWRLSGPDASLVDQATQDLAYVRNYSVWEDLRILWESIRRSRKRRLAPLLGRWLECEARGGSTNLGADGAVAPGGRPGHRLKVRGR